MSTQLETNINNYFNMQIINRNFTESIRGNSKALYRLSYEFDCHSKTIERWLDQNDKGEVTNLTTPMGLKAISEELDVKKSELLTETE